MGWVRRLRSTILGSHASAEFDEEARFHLNRRIDEYVKSGMPPEEARREASRRLGSVTLAREQTRDVDTLRWLADLRQDARYAARALRHNPGFTVVAIVTLALGIGANTAIFSVLNAALIRPLPVPRPEELFFVKVSAPVPVQQLFTYAAFEELRDATPQPAVLAGMSRVAGMQGRIGGSSESERLNVQLVSGEYFSVIGLAPVRGRLLGPDDNRTVGGHPVAVISESLWRRRFAGASGVLGDELTLNGSRFTIIGVGPPGFSGMWLEAPTDVWVPLVMQQDVRYAQNYSANSPDPSVPWPLQDRVWWLQLIGRTGQRAQTAAVLNGVRARRAEGLTNPEDRRRFLERRLTLDPLTRGLSNVRTGLSTPLFVLMAMVALLLLIACANGANLLLARAAARRREIAIRLSMGASRGRLLQQLLTESSLLVGMAAVLGVVLARWAGSQLARRLLDADAGAPSASVPLDASVLVFTALVSIAVGLLFGLAPALRTTEVDLGTAMRQGRKPIGIGAHLGGPKLLVAVQVALSLWLVVGAGLFVRSLQNLTRVELGFEPDHVVTVWIDPRIGRYQESQLVGLNQRLVARVEALPGVQSASLAMCGLMSGCRATADVQIAGYQPREGEAVRLQENRVGVGYFSTVGMRVIAGRDFDGGDAGRAPRVAIVNETMARRYFPDRNAIGQRFGYEKPNVEIIGVVEDARVNGIEAELVGMAYYPLGPGEGAFSLDVRVSGDPRTAIADVRRAVVEVDPNLPVTRITTLTDQVDRTLDQERFVASLTTLFGLLALGLACLGLFGVMSYTVSRRTSEFGVRMALGAKPSSLLWTVFRESQTLVLLGLSVGLPTMWMASRFLTRVLFGIPGDDPTTLAGATLVLVIVASLAGLVPAWRASRVDPMVALRHE